MARIRLRIHPTGHVEAQVEDVSDDRCHGLIEEAAAPLGVILTRRPTPPPPGGRATGARVPTSPRARPRLTTGDAG
jgi:hypothetical protein